MYSRLILQLEHLVASEIPPAPALETSGGSWEGTSEGAQWKEVRSRGI